MIIFVERESIPDGEPCEHPGCLQHITHPCEGCGRIAGMSLPELPEVWRQYFVQLEERVRELKNEQLELISEIEAKSYLKDVLAQWIIDIKERALGGK